jgi:flagellar capping protein FliD
MDPEISALMSVYQKRLNDMTAQAIAYEARIAVLTATLQQLQTPQQPVAQEPAPVAKKRGRKTPETTDAGSF